jgi:hypothetical protein
MTTSDTDFAALVDAHFSGRISPAAERRLRAHLPTCARCRARYDRHLLLASLDPKALSAEERIARGLGVGAGPLRALRDFRLGPIGAALAGGAAVVGLAAGLVFRLPGSGPADEFVARGGPAAVEEGPAFVAYRVRGDTTAPLEDGALVAPGDELAFGYANPGPARHLLVFGVDEHQHVFWYHPAWTDPGGEPSSITIEPGPLLRELPEAVAHNFDGARLRLFAVFSERPLTVRQIEALLPAQAHTRTCLPIPQTTQRTLTLRLGGAS